MKPEQPFEDRGHGLTGYATLDFKRNKDFTSLAAQITEYNPDRFEPVALKVFASEGELIVTIYAVDKSAQEKESINDQKLPVKKFKLFTKWEELMPLIKHFDLIVSNQSYSIEDFMVINK